MTLGNTPSSYMFILITYTIVISTLIVISSSNLLIAWLCLELNLFCFTPVLLDKAINNEVEASLNYFLPQAVGSSIFIFNSISIISYPWFSKLSLIFIIMALLINSGAAPCHYWYPNVIEQSSWLNCFLLSTWQNISPIFIILYTITINVNYFIIIIAPINATLGAIIGLNQLSLNNIMAYSSISHIGWILSILLTNTPCLFIVYLLVYSTIIAPLFLLFNTTKLENTYDTWNNQNLALPQIIFISLFLLSLSGIPPLSGFIPNFLIISMLINHSTNIAVLLITGSVINLFLYLNIITNILISLQNHYYKSNNSNINLSTILVFIAMNIFFLIIFII